MKDGKASFVDARDIAAVAAHALAGSGHEGKSYQITGPEALSFADVARKLAAALKKPVSYVDIPREPLIQAMTGAGMPDWQARAIAELYDSFRPLPRGRVSMNPDLARAMSGVWRSRPPHLRRLHGLDGHGVADPFLQ